LASISQSEASSQHHIENLAGRGDGVHHRLHSREPRGVPAFAGVLMQERCGARQHLWTPDRVVRAAGASSDPNPPAPRGAVVTYGGERPSISSPS
jgi:hypothetical protein